jgi:hypothetical protein
MQPLSPLLANAISSIEAGVEDFKLKEPKRAGSAVRNFYAGVLLLLKEKLRRESPPGSDDALLYERIEFRRSAGGDIVFVGSGRKTTPAFRERTTSSAAPSKSSS